MGGMRYKGTILDWRRSGWRVLSDVWVRKWRLAVEVERHVSLHAFYLRWTAVFVVAAVVVGTAIKVARTFVLVGTAMLLAG
jgi:hypothetical protein